VRWRPGALTRMGRPKHGPNRLTIDGLEYAWEYRHGWLVDWSKGLKAISVSVSLDPGRTRELILELTFAVPGPERDPSHSKVGHAVVAAIRRAIEAGWEPESRGKAFRHKVGPGV
jgi:hypothetical protein